MSDIKILDDCPVSDSEFFNFDAYANAITGIIESKRTGTPLVVGVIGDWGSGKTTLMKIIKKKIEQEEHISTAQTIWFNAWKYDREDSIRRALLMRVLQELKTKDKTDEEKTDKEKKLDQDLTDLQDSLYQEVHREEMGDLRFDWGKAAKGAAKGTLKLSLSMLPVVGNNLTRLLETVDKEEAIKLIVESIQREKRPLI